VPLAGVGERLGQAFRDARTIVFLSAGPARARRPAMVLTTGKAETIPWERA
jgi:hypothetical protein